MSIALDDVISARYRIGLHILCRPMDRSFWLGDLCGSEVYLKVK